MLAARSKARKVKEAGYLEKLAGPCSAHWLLLWR